MGKNLNEFKEFSSPVSKGKFSLKLDCIFFPKVGSNPERYYVEIDAIQINSLGNDTMYSKMVPPFYSEPNKVADEIIKELNDLKYGLVENNVRNEIINSIINIVKSHPF